MQLLQIIGIVSGALLALILLVLGLRGRFGTARQRGEFELFELAHSEEVPRRTIAKDPVTCRGSTMDGHAPIGSGVLWLTNDTLGFVRRSPRRHLRIPVRSIDSVTVASTYHRAGIDEVADEIDFLIVAWLHDGGELDTIAFLTPDPKRWASAIEAAREG